MLKKAQAATELFFAIGLILLFFMMMFLINSEKTQNITTIQRSSVERGLCQEISNAISNIYSKGDGSSVTLDLRDHSVEFNRESQTLLVDDEYPCTIPITDVTDGTQNNVFSVSDIENLRITNINNVVYINTACITYPLSFAEDHNSKTITSQLKYNDLVKARLEFKRNVNNSIQDYNQYLIDHDLRIAMLNKANGCDQPQEENIFHSFNCQEAGTPGYETLRCHIFKSESTIADLFENENGYSLQNYQLIVLEQQSQQFPDSEQMVILEDWVSQGNVLIAGDRLAKKSSDLFGISWTYVQNDPIGYFLTLDSSYYSNPDKFLILGGTAQDPATWDPSSSHYVSCTGLCTEINYTNFARFPDNKHGLSRWYYGSGEVYYFSSMCNDPDTYNGGSLTTRVGDLINRIIGSYKNAYINTTIDFEPELGYTATTQNTTKTVFFIESNPVQPDPSYSGSISEQVDDNYRFRCSGLTEANNLCNMDIANLLGDKIKLKTDFSIYEFKTTERYVDIDYQDLKVCYEY